MKLTIENLGPISHAEVDLSKDLIVLSGHNNTGKTYLVNAIYALGEYNVNIEDSFSEDYMMDSGNNLTLLLQSALFEKKILIEREIADDLRVVLEKVFQTDFEDQKSGLMEVEFSDKEIQETLPATIDMIFNGQDEDGEYLIFRFEDKKGRYEFGSDSYYVDHDIETVKQRLAEIAVNEALSHLFPTRIIPIVAERQGVSIFYPEILVNQNRVLKELLGDSEKDKKRLRKAKLHINRYPLPVQKAVERANSYAMDQLKSSPFEPLAASFEAEILGGKFRWVDPQGYQFIPKGSSAVVPIHNSSSTVKSLANLIHYLRHQAEKGDLVLIDEPELNLHPDNQVLIARLITRMVNNGLKVVVSTHSDHIIREINNMIMLGNAKDRQKKKVDHLCKSYNIPSDAPILGDKVGAYLFQRGKPVESIPVEADGFAVKTIDSTINLLNEITETLYEEVLENEGQA